ncbi:MAG: hypothetical protein ABL973_13150 [Micropepsaceae bacterium]
MKGNLVGLAWVWLALMLMSVSANASAVNGSKSFVARPKVGNAQLNLPASVRWDSSVNPDGSVRVVLNADVDVQPVITDIRKLSAKALDRAVPCGTLVKVRNAAAKVTGPRSLSYDLSFHYSKRICGAGIPLEMPADVSCSSRIGIAVQGALVLVDVLGAATPACRIEGAYQGVSDAVSRMVGGDVFKRHRIDLASLLPAEFKGVVINVRTLAFDVPPAPAKLRITGDSQMTRVQFDKLVAALEAASPKAK